MRANEVMGLVFANVRDKNISELTDYRAMASVFFGAKYRLIDFTLSNLVNSGIYKVGVLTESNYRSLMDHISSGKPWDLDRKYGGLYILPPYNTAEVGRFKGTVRALDSAMTFLSRSKEKYVVMCNANVVSNIDIEAVVDSHLKSDCDITVCYKNGTMPENKRDMIALNVDGKGNVTDIRLDAKGTENVNYSLGIWVIEKELLMKLISEAAARNLYDFSRDVVMALFNAGKLKVKGYEITTYAEVLDSPQSYVDASMKLLDASVRRELFVKNRPIYTKSRDNMPTRYGVSSDISNTLLGEGCVIDGTVKNSIIFRDVIIESGAVVENCILMQGVKVGKNSHLKYVAADKNTEISENSEIFGAEKYYNFIKKDAKI